MADQVDEVKSKVDIVDIIGQRITLKKAGSNYKANCPFHNEKTPSFMVSPELQIFKCFGCVESGDVLSFLEKYEAMDFYEALKYLADKVGIKLKSNNQSTSSEKARIFQLNEFASNFYHYVLLKHQAGKVALKYVLQDRGLEMETIKVFKIGYSPNQPFAIKNFLIQKHGFKLKELEKAGLVWVRDGNGFDRFRGRITFPLHDQRGNTIGFAGRIIPGTDKDGLAKYINSPETPVYHKSHTLYGLDLVKKEIKKMGEAVVVEGELDMISSWQAGIKNVVAIKGSAFTSEQVKLLRRYTQKLVLALDTDIAGDTAAKRGIKIAQDEGMDITVANLGKYKDPDEAARADPELLKKSIKNASNIWDFLIVSIFSKYGTSSGQSKTKISREVVPILASIEDSITQAHYINLVAEKLGVPVEAVTNAVSKRGVPRVETTNSEKVVNVQKKENRQDILEKRLIALSFLQDPKTLLKEGNNQLITTVFGKRVVEELKKYHNKLGKKKFILSDFSKSLPKELFDGFSSLFMQESSADSADDDQELEKELQLVIKEIKILNLKRSLARVGDEISKVEKHGDKNKLSEANKKFSELSQKLSEAEVGN